MGAYGAAISGFANFLVFGFRARFWTRFRELIGFSVSEKITTVNFESTTVDGYVRVVEDS